VAERATVREIARTIVEPLTLALAVSLATLGGFVGWEAHRMAAAPAVEVAPTTPPARSQATAEADAYVDALCAQDVAYLGRHTGEAAGPMPWEPRLSEWVVPCTRHRYLGALVDPLGRDQFVFTLVRPDGAEAVYVVTFGHDGLVAGID
jgi:uncharacterized iron-regulated membrane protein